MLPIGNAADPLWLVAVELTISSVAREIGALVALKAAPGRQVCECRVAVYRQFIADSVRPLVIGL